MKLEKAIGGLMVVLGIVGVWAIGEWLNNPHVHIIRAT